MRPAAFTVPRVDVCFVCLPGGPHTPPPCLVCGRAGFFYHQGLCTACHPFSPERRGSCPDCYAWGTSRASKWRCWGCLGWHRKFSKVGPGGTCTWCRRAVAVNHDRVCRMCWQQRSRMRRASGDPHLSYARALEDGFVQLSFANTRAQERHLLPAPAPAAPVAPHPLPAPHRHRQLTLFPAPARVMTAGLHGRFPQPPDPWLAGRLCEELTTWARTHGWSLRAASKTRHGLRIVLALQETPGARVPASLIYQLTDIDLPAGRVHAFLTAHDFAEDDRTRSIDAWFARTTAHLPQPVIGQLAHWLTVRVNGHTSPPRSQPRSPTTVRHQLRFALPVLTRLTTTGTNIRSLGDVTAAQLRTALSDCRLKRTDHAHTASALRSVFTTLHAHRKIGHNPAVHLRVGTHARTIPLPADTALIREALTSTDPARAAVTALFAFHALRAGEIRRLTLTDTRDLDEGLLHLPGRTIHLAAPVHMRLDAYLAHRHQRWPDTANPHLFITRRTALDTSPASNPWLHRQQPLSSDLLRADRILDEVLAARGDARMICELFGLGIEAAARYTAADSRGLQ
ncbi:hypothetical protein ACFVMA_18910 [Streptomyces rochei]|uniref:hypothetical protein n=1 Tax=Streptomyces rochei TaxID=1928 RepID=UPI0036799DCE